jgi:hypothetical protein
MYGKEEKNLQRIIFFKERNLGQPKKQKPNFSPGRNQAVAPLHLSNFFFSLSQPPARAPPFSPSQPLHPHRHPTTAPTLPSPRFQPFPLWFLRPLSPHTHDLPSSAEHKVTVFSPNQGAAGAALPLHNSRHCSSPLPQLKLSLCTQSSLLPSPDLIPPACNHREHHLQAFPLCQHNNQKRAEPLAQL